MLQQLNDAFECLGLTQGKQMLFVLGQCCVDAPSFAMVTSLVVLSVAVGPICEGVLTEATNYIHNLINLFTYMCVPNGDANYYYLEQWIVHMHKDPLIQSLSTASYQPPSSTYTMRATQSPSPPPRARSVPCPWRA
jgi:hypothetical protein